MATRLCLALASVMERTGWLGAVGNVDVCIEGPREPVQPDFLLSPPNCARWGELELRSSGVTMVAEVVSPTSVHRDRVDKVELYAVGGIPVYLLIDPIANPATVTVYSGIQDRAYRAFTTVSMGTPIYLPKPVDFELDTSVFKV